MQFLHRHGVATVARNIRCRRGEIDLVCLDGDILVFVEVRLRSDDRFGGAAESITPEKRQRIISAARWWLKGLGHTHTNRVCRFDALLLSQLDESRITWVRDAFTANDG